MSTQKPWEHAKSSGSEADPLAARFVESLSYDRRIYKQDIAGSIAHARMLQYVGLITEQDLGEIERGLKEIEAEIEADFDGWPGWQIELEDVHMCIEAALIEKVGEPGRKLHTGRSRNDQVALDLMLWIEDTSHLLTDLILNTCSAFVELAEDQGRIVMPSYTHLQRAQPILVGAELLAWAEALHQCNLRLDALRTLDRNPLGSGAIAGSSLPLDRRAADSFLLGDNAQETDQAIAELMQNMFELTDDDTAAFDNATSLTVNSIQSTASRDIALDFVYALSMTAMWLSRWAEQWIIYASTEFSFISLDHAYTTGSSMMPQKRNPDMLELIRGRCGNVYGSLVSLLTMCKGITIGYNRDLQEDKRHVFAAYDTVRDCLDMATRIVKTTKFNEDRIKQGLDRGFLDATSLAEYLVTRGVAFRTAHQVVGSLVHTCEEQGKYKLEQLSVDEMNSVANATLERVTGSKPATPAIADDVYDWLGPENVVKRYQTYGNAGLTGFEEQLKEWKERLSGTDAPDTA